MHQKWKLQAASFMLFMFQFIFCITFFQNCCSCSSAEQVFAKRLQANWINFFFGPSNGLDKSILYLLIYSFRFFWPFRSPFCSLRALFKILLLAAVPCIFRPQSPVSKNECMHRCNNFVNFVYDLLFSLCLPCFEHLFLQNIILFSENMLPALGGKHDFESGTNVKSWKMCLLGPPVMPVCTLFAPHYCNLKFAKSIGKMCISCL